MVQSGWALAFVKYSDRYADMEDEARAARAGIWQWQCERPWDWRARVLRGVPQDDAEAVKWYRRAAEGGHAFAQFHLGFMYDEGRGVPQDKAEAVKWYRRLRDQGAAHQRAG
jgi:hypothetical protein